ncbi:hypothetical protein [Microbulbifer sp.]|uniref:hypothetical protein n=1 Tax=Microbulbifer sp. TaxID=1908541 RepID=UPI002584EA4F|nr:hypothetical protein [Microbulbifer sp.]
MEKALEFEPYKNYLELYDYIDNFLSISSLSYGITKQLLNKHGKADLKGIDLPEPNKKALSFSMADINVKDVEFICGWISCSEYAKKLEISEAEVIEKANIGKLGHKSEHPKSGECILIWPEEYQSKELDELPAPGKSKFKPKVSITAKAGLSIDTDELTGFEDKQMQLVRLAHAVGDKDKVTNKAETMLFQSSFLLNWTAFEVFIRESIHSLYRAHPKKLTKGQKGSAQSLSYKDIFQMSAEFDDIEKLKFSLIEMEIDKHQKDGESITGLINFLKSEFKFENDPYNAWYVLKGDKKKSSFNRITEIKDVRNALMHNAGKDVDTLIEEYPHLQREDNNLIINDDYYHETALIMKSVAFSIAKDVVSEKYRTNDS